MAGLLLLLVCLGLSQGEQTSRAPADDHTCSPTVAEAIEIMRVRTFKRLEEHLQDKTNALIHKTKENTQLTQQLSELQAKMDLQQQDYETEKQSLRAKHEAEKQSLQADHEAEKKSLQADHEAEKKSLLADLKASDSLVSFMMNVLEKSKETVDERNELLVEQSKTIDTLKIESTGYRNSEEDFVKVMQNYTSIIQVQREAIENSKKIIKDQDLLSSNYLNIKGLESNGTKCDIPPYLKSITEALNTQQDQIKGLKGLVKNEEIVANLIEQVAGSLGKQEKVANTSEGCDALVAKSQLVVEKQATSLALMQELMSFNMTRTPGLHYEHDGQGRLTSVERCQCLPELPANTTAKLAWSGQVWSGLQPWTSWTFNNCGPTPGNSSFCGGGTRTRTRLHSLEDHIWREEREEVACPSCSDAQCFRSYTTLSRSDRMVKYSSASRSSDLCDNRLATGWYRFTFPGTANGDYARIPTHPPAKQYQGRGLTCGTHGTAWMRESLPVVGEPPKNVVMRFAWDGTDDRTPRRVSGTKVVSCLDGDDKEFFLYYLKPTGYCTLAYCATTEA